MYVTMNINQILVAGHKFFRNSTMFGDKGAQITSQITLYNNKSDLFIYFLFVTFIYPYSFCFKGLQG